MAVPARKTSKQKKRSRRGHIKLTTPAMHYDATYKGRQVANEKKQQNND